MAKLSTREDLTERQANERLLNYSEDVVLLRRYLVDAGLLERVGVGILILPAGCRTIASGRP